MEIKNEMKHLN